MATTYRLEADFQRAVLKRLRAVPRSWWVKIHDLVTFGLPDVIGCLGGRFVAIELKRRKPGVRMTLQAHILGKIRAAGGYAEFWHPGNWEAELALLLGESP